MVSGIAEIADRLTTLTSKQLKLRGPFPVEQKLTELGYRLVEDAWQKDGAVVSEVARRHDITPQHLSNIVERSIRPMVLNRKNALFAGHDQGAENWACIASLIETCKLHGVDPQAYFADVLTKLVNLWPASRLDELMPWAWAAERSSNKLAA